MSQVSIQPRGSIYTAIMELGPGRPFPLWFWGPSSIIVVFMDPLGNIMRKHPKPYYKPFESRSTWNSHSMKFYTLYAPFREKRFIERGMFISCMVKHDRPLRMGVAPTSATHAALLGRGATRRSVWCVLCLL